jgi:hypothetical protein
MGTDIHMRAEIRTAPDAPWEAVGSIFPNPSFDPVATAQHLAERKAEGKDDPEGYTPYFGHPTTAEPYGGRNYTLFAALSDVRNGFGFAGVPTGEPIPSSVAAGRGLPDDLARHFDEESYQERLRYKEWDSKSPRELSNAELAEELFIFGEHSQGWITLAELLDYDWDYEVTHYGVVGAQEFRRCYESGFELEPRSWCGDISGANVVKLDANEANRLIRAGEFPEAAGDDARTDIIEGFGRQGQPSIHVYHSWSHKLREDVQGFLDVVDKMRHWGRDYNLWHKDGNGSQNPKATMHDPTCIRLVFGYDS